VKNLSSFAFPLTRVVGRSRSMCKSTKRSTFRCPVPATLVLRKKKIYDETGLTNMNIAVLA
jgi:hypothetical protein